MFGFDFNKIFGTPKGKQPPKTIKEQREQYLADLQKKKDALLEKANHLAKEKELRKEIAAQEKRIKDNSPANGLGNFISMIPVNWRKPLLVIGVILVLIFVLVKSCGS
jgi:hypothetical protein